MAILGRKYSYKAIVTLRFIYKKNKCTELDSLGQFGGLLAKRNGKKIASCHTLVSKDNE